MSDRFRVVRLPGFQFTVRPTGVKCRVKDVPDRGLFEHDGHIWEKTDTTSCCLTDLHDESEVLWCTQVEQWEEVKLVEREEPWIPYQPQRQRDKDFYDIKLRGGVVVECCWPNGVHWNPMLPVRAKGVGSGPIADYRVLYIRKCRGPEDRDDV